VFQERFDSFKRPLRGKFRSINCFIGHYMVAPKISLGGRMYSDWGGRVWTCGLPGD